MPVYRNEDGGSLVVADVMPGWGVFTEVSDSVVRPSKGKPAKPVEADPEPAADPEPEAVSMPGPRATVKAWVEFMAEQGIEHPEDATKAEMQAIAAKHFN